MPLAQWALSALFVVFVMAQVLIGMQRTEDWPLTAMPMFAQYFPSDLVPVRITLVATMQDGTERELTGADLGLTEDELHQRLVFQQDLREACGALGRSFNAGRPPALQLWKLVARREGIARPGIPRETSRLEYKCSLVPPPPRPGTP